MIEMRKWMYKLSRVINNIDVEFNVGGLGKANKIIEKEAKVYESNLF